MRWPLVFVLFEELNALKILTPCPARQIDVRVAECLRRPPLKQSDREGGPVSIPAAVKLDSGLQVGRK